MLHILQSWRTRLQNFWATRAKRTTDFEVVAAKNRLLLASAMEAQNDPVGFIGEQVLNSGSVSSVQSLRSQMNVDANTVGKSFDYGKFITVNFELTMLNLQYFKRKFF